MDKIKKNELVAGNTYDSIEIIDVEDEKTITIMDVTFKKCLFRSIENVNFSGCRFVFEDFKIGKY